MATNKRKQDEKHLKMLREMVALPSNKTCFDCHQRGPTYVNMTIGSFVCTSCSGILRGLNPPHRVKSISMASFTPEEMDFLKMHGNELNRKVFLGLYDNRTWPEPDSRDEQRVRDFMVQKYENKRFYVAPTDAMREEAKHMNEAALSKQPQVKPLRSLLGENATKLVVNSQPSHVPHNNTPAPVTAAAMAAVPKPSVPAATLPQQPAKASTGFDLLGDLGADPFASSAPAAPASSAGGFADFSSFGATSVAPAAQPVHSAAPATFPVPSASLQPFGSAGGLQPLSATTLNAAAPQPSAPPSASAPTNFSAISDKYAALADLDSTFSTAATTSAAPQTVHWGGSDSTVGSSMSGAINWGGSTPGSTGSGDTGGPINWGGPSSSGAGGGGSSLGWTSGANTMPSGQTAVGGGGVFGATSTAANPFGGSATPAMSHAGGMPGQPNPFGAGGAASAFGQAPVSTAPTSFGYQQFPVQNGGFGMTSTAGGFPYSTAPATYGVAPQGFQAQAGMAQGFGMPQQPPMSGFGGPPAHPPPAYGAQQGFGGGWGQMGGGVQQQSANPFMSAANQQVAPRGASTNPFL